MAKVSVIIPVYNVAPYLRQNLDSVLAQTVTDIEVICVDDGSDDGSAKILKEYAQADKRVKVFHQKNAGAGAARNLGLFHARGEFLSFLDSDDFFEPRMLEKMVALAEADDDDFVVCLSDQFHMDAQSKNAMAQRATGFVQNKPSASQPAMTDGNKGLAEKSPAGRQESACNAAASNLSASGSQKHLSGHFVSAGWVVRQEDIPPFHPFSWRNVTGNPFKVFVGWAWDKLYRRSFVEAHHLKFQEQRTTNDMLFVFSALVLAEKISVVDEVLVHQRRDASDSLSKTREDSWWCFHDALTALRLRLRREDLFRELQQDYVNYALHAVLWNYRSLAEPSKRLLKAKLEDGWLAQLGILSKPRSYFYSKGEYDEMKRTFHPRWGGKAKKGQESKPKSVKTLVKDVAQDVLKKKDPVRAIKDAKALMAVSRAKAKSLGRKVIPPGREYLDSVMKNHLADEKAEHLRQEERLKQELESYVRQELERREAWAVRTAEDMRTAGNKPYWVIKCPSPEDESRVRWGDYPYAMSLKKYLEREGIFVAFDFHEDWNRREENADVVLVLRGSFRYHPDRRNTKTLYIMWNISHPADITDEEYNSYDLVCVASKHYAKTLESRLTVPVVVLLQCTDTELFYPPKMARGQKDGLDNRRDYDFFFIGNSRGIKRRSVMWAIEDNLPITIFGSGWNSILEDHLDLVEEPFLSNDQIPEIYRHAKCTLNDHWKDMLEYQFVNNRIFDALACGLPVISDENTELRTIFPHAVLYYTSREEFREAVDQVQNHYDEVKKRVDSQWKRIKEKFSFEARAKELIELAQKYQKNG